MQKKTSWETLDYRDAKYHGSVVRQGDRVIKDGPGILVLDENFLIISQWQNNEPTNHRTLIFTPTFDILEVISETKPNNKIPPSPWIDRISLLECYSSLGS